ncbi:putative monovalent cation/H+ antiporter subunit A [Hoeflea prorocentri]|uniref:Monovalent cation/H+ antiporter subunit A n=1 Tax=Hoeflea prorocentri TaxID=1922333 RepID=A0A9X3UJF1_9HYPH|nr:putative monovalent cation/H+ antiporter subunit A [Hoeflea prorocentri]MCY6381530.1 putative monovalent cation/H+ antiporter subunit A [Hoeflea prorocentri]MDA5399330.1 putative monovalent cation/H+ antiporter subunit A [Hoeflea prorocentri]
MVSDTPSTTLFVLLLPFIAALIAPALTRRLGHNAAWVLALVPVTIFWHFATFLPEISRGEVVTGGFQWIPAFQVNFSWFIDGLSLTFALLISGIGVLIVLYSGGYLKGHAHLGRFFSFILMFMGSMLGLVASDSFLMFFVFWELTSITSFLLIGFDHKREASRRAALQALVVTGGGGLFLLAGLLMIWNITGISELSLLLLSGSPLADSPFYIAVFVLVLGGAFTKSAQFPLHFWLPNAMEAPTPVSAYLHSATMVKAGVYLLMRLNPVLGDTVAWETVLPIFGGTTLIVGTLLAIRQTDLKLMLAYTTVSSLGLLVMLTGFGTEKAIAAAVLYLVAHSMFKGALFMVAGCIDHEAGTRDVTKLGGLMAAMPITFAAALASAVSMAGLPPFFGFLAKEEIYYGLWGVDAWPLLLTLVAIVGNGLMFVIGFAVALKPFFGQKKPELSHAHEGPVLLWLGPAVLALASLFTALFSGVSHEFISIPMASAVQGEPVSVYISLIPHIGMPLLLSGVTVAFGIVAYLNVDRLRAVMARLLVAIGWGPDRGFDQFIRGLVLASFSITKVAQPGRMEIYMRVTFILVIIAILAPMIFFGELPALPTWPSDPPFYELAVYELAIMAIAAVGLVAVIYANNRLTAIVSLGIQGFAVALLFMLFGAPDLSFTQFMVETLSVVILALAMTRLKLTPADHRPVGRRYLDMTIACFGAGAFMLMLLKVTQQPFDLTLSEFFTTYSLSVAYGANIVNVILVDFRGTDTWGEIGVVMVAGLAILSLIRINKRRAAYIAANDPYQEERE